MPKRVVILGAGGRDFHNFNTVFRGNPEYHVVAFTATQIPNIERRVYPPSLAGPGYPDGIPVVPEEELPGLIKRHGVEEAVFSYSDVSHQQVMHVASAALAVGASFRLISPRATMLQADVPVVAVCAVRSGAGKSPTSRLVAQTLRSFGHSAVIVRHPMPYGDLAAEAVQRYATFDDLDRYGCTIEEREEYEPHLERGFIVYAGIDYGLVLQRAQREATVLVWDGGNNDTPFFRPDLWLVVADPLRAGDEVLYHPGETNLRLADAVIINKTEVAAKAQIRAVEANVKRMNPRALVLHAESPITVDRPDDIAGKRVLVVEDGPTMTHGGLPTGAGYRAAQIYGAGEIVDPRPWAAGSIAETYRRYPHIGPVLPAMGYGAEQRLDLLRSIQAVPCDLVVVATPIDLKRVIPLDVPTVRVGYDLQIVAGARLEEVLASFRKVSAGRA